MQPFRDGIMVLFQSSSTCWAVAVNDYGAMISTLMAISTFATLFFFAYMLHKTLASRTPENKLRQQQNAEKHRRKKRKPHHHARGAKGSGGGRLRSSGTQQELRPDDINLVDGSHAKGDECVHTESSLSPSQTPSVDDQPFQNSAIADPSIASLATPTKDDKSRLVPRRLQIISSPPLHLATNCVDDQSSCGTESGRSTPTPAAANEFSHEAVVSALETSADPSAELGQQNAKANQSPPGAQSRVPSAASRRSQNSRRGKKSAAAAAMVDGISANNTAHAPIAPSPSKRWDALKPTTSRAGNGRQRQPASARSRGMRDVESARFGTHSCPSLSESSGKRAISISPMRGDSLQDRPLPVHQAFPVPSMGYMQGASLSSGASTIPLAKCDGYGSSAEQRTPDSFANSLNHQNYTARSSEQPAPFFSSLNPNSPWNDRVHQAGAPTRLPPGLETFRNDIPFGCGSSDGGNSAPASPFQYPPSLLDAYNSDFYGVQGGSAVSLPFHPSKKTENLESDLSFFCDYDGLSTPPDEANDSFSHRAAPGRIAPPRATSDQYSHLRENPFATSDEEAEEDQIVAELQELGGQMVGSILDF